MTDKAKAQMHKHIIGICKRLAIFPPINPPTNQTIGADNNTIHHFITKNARIPAATSNTRPTLAPILLMIQGCIFS